MLCTPNGLRKLLYYAIAITHKLLPHDKLTPTHFSCQLKQNWTWTQIFFFHRRNFANTLYSWISRTQATHELLLGVPTISFQQENQNVLAACLQLEIIRGVWQKQLLNGNSLPWKTMEGPLWQIHFEGHKIVPLWINKHFQ